MLDAGADDYLVKPFGIGELLARLRVALRHRGTVAQPAITLYRRAGLEVDLTAHRVRRDGVDVRLTPTEFKLLARLVRQAGQVVTHRRLLADVWGADATEQTHYLRLYMGQLRAKLEADPGEPCVLLTEPGVGYRIAEAAGGDAAPHDMARRLLLVSRALATVTAMRKGRHGGIDGQRQAGAVRGGA